MRRKNKGKRGGRRENRNRDEYWYPEISKENQQFESYYKALQIVPEDEEKALWEAMRRELPASFRFTGSKGHALTVQKRLVEHYIPKVMDIQYEGKPVPPPTQLEWYPEKLAWHMTTPKTVIRKNPNFSPLHKFLVSETAVGNISRQEVVSMIPPLFMDVEPGMTVLDMCAAPGSKTAQLCEMMHTGEEARVRKLMRQLGRENGREPSPDGDEIAADADEAETKGDHLDDGRATGLLIANDNNYQRAQMLVHQIKRLNSPNLIVTCHDATMFPSIRLQPEEGKRTHRYLKFDRILADVPCSGDGTCRKNINVWKDWTPANGLGLHPTQTRILTRALQMLKVGGRVVYSTCSLNPIENEAVLSAAIDRCGGLSQVDLVDCNNALPLLKRRPGLRHWTVTEKSGRLWNSWDEVDQDEGGKVTKSMFPPSPSLDGKEIPFERAMRVYPHLQDSGGFFIAVLEKKSEIKARPENAKPDNKPSAQASEALESENPAPRIGSAVAVANEIEAQTESGILPEANANRPALEAFASTKVEVNDSTNGATVEPVVPQTESGSSPQGPTKRELEEGNDESVPSKRIKAELDPTESKTSGKQPKLEQKTLAPLSQGPKRRGQPQEEAFKYLPSDHPVLEEITRFYDVSPRFPRDRYMVRNPSGDPVKAIYYTSSLAKEILTENEGRSMKFVHCGVKMFMKQDAQREDVCRWRIQAEGIPIIDPWVGEDRIVRLYKRDTLYKLLIELFPKVGGGGWQSLGEIGECVRDMSMGCCILRVEPSQAEDGFRDRLVLPLWRSMHSLNLMLPKEERKAMLLRLYGSEAPLVDNSNFNKNKANLDTEVTSNGVDLDIEDVPTPESDIDVKIQVEAGAASEPDEEDGGVPVPPEAVSQVEAASYGAETKDMEMEDAIKREVVNKQDQSIEVAPGVNDEEERFNTTV